MKIQVIPNVLSLEQINTLMQDINPRETATEQYYANNTTTGIKKVRCSDHPIVKNINNSLEYITDSVAIVYYPINSYNAAHADNCIVDENYNFVKRVKDWTHTGIIFLNENFTGGELVYPNQGCVFLPKAGNMIITPAGEEYIHFVTPILSGERFTLVFRFI